MLHTSVIWVMNVVNHKLSDLQKHHLNTTHETIFSLKLFECPFGKEKCSH